MSKDTVRPCVSFKGDLLRDALTEYLRNRGHDVKGHVEAYIFKPLPSPGRPEPGHVTLSWDGDPIEKGGK